MTTVHVPSTVRGDELHFVADCDADELLLARLRDLLRPPGANAADVAVRLTAMLELGERHFDTTEPRHANGDSPGV